MKFSIKGNATEVPVHTIAVIPENSDNLNIFHCPYDGNSVVQYTGHITKITPYSEPYDKELVLSGCRKCGAKYNLQTQRYSKNTVTRVVLHPGVSGRTFFYCYKGRGQTPLLIYTYDGIWTNDKGRMSQIPFIAGCVDPDCREKYLFTDLV